MNFRLRSIGSTRTRLTTETRVFTTDAMIRRRFAAYWRVIYPGSSIIRMMWLRAIKRRAELPVASNLRAVPDFHHGLIAFTSRIVIAALPEGGDSLV